MQNTERDSSTSFYYSIVYIIFIPTVVFNVEMTYVFTEPRDPESFCNDLL